MIQSSIIDVRIGSEYASIILIHRKGIKFKLINFKDYLRYKTITSRNVSSEVQVKDFFVS